jgi:hypothetical protein
LFVCFCFHYFWDKVSFYAMTDLDLDAPICSSLHSWDGRHVSPHPVFIGWDRVLQTFCPDWPQTAILLISTSPVARITGMYYHTQLLAEVGSHEHFVQAGLEPRSSSPSLSPE